MKDGTVFAKRSVTLSACVVLLLTSWAQAALMWAPPALDNPITIQLGANGFTQTNLDNTRDYIIKLPDTLKTGGVMLEGGRNVVIIGGHITVAPNQPSDMQRRGIYLKNQVGTVHIEGVLIDGSGGGESDGIAINAPQATVQIENCRIVGLTGRVNGFHADVVQPWGGVKELRIDHLTGSSNYQGLQIPSEQDLIQKADIRNVDLSYTGPAVDATVTYMMYLTNSAGRTYDIDLDNFYITPRPGQSLANACVWPSTLGPAGLEAVYSNGQLTWPHLPTVTGSVIQGPPPGGSFVPEGLAGVGYVPEPVSMSLLCLGASALLIRRR